MSFFLGPNDHMGRLQLNYVSVSGDEEDYKKPATLCLLFHWTLF